MVSREGPVNVRLKIRFCLVNVCKMDIFTASDFLVITASLDENVRSPMPEHLSTLQPSVLNITPTSRALALLTHT